MEESSIGAAFRPSDVKPEELVQNIKKGDPRAEELFYRRYFSGLVLMLERRTRDRGRAEDLAQDTMVTVLERLRGSGIDHPERLNSFVHQTAKYQFIGWLRKAANKTELIPDYDDRTDDVDTADEGLDKERARAQVRKVISEMNVARDRELLYRFYVRDQSKPVICEALDLTPTHFDRVINRARNRFREAFLKEAEL